VNPATTGSATARTAAGPGQLPGPAVVGSVHSWDISTGVDGPGTRFVVFTQGCPLRCLYCHNPETWRMREGRRTDSDAVLGEAAKYVPFIAASGGGATVSGGEPLLQPRFTAALLRGFQDLGLHTALDTSGFLGTKADAGLLDATDLVLLDIKSWDTALYRRLTGVALHPTLAFARRLADLGKPVHLRFVLVPGLTDEPANIDGLARFARQHPTRRRAALPQARRGQIPHPRPHLPAGRHPLAHHGADPRGARTLRRGRPDRVLIFRRRRWTTSECWCSTPDPRQ
jgi:pyruvate formate lyase activating enzyme